MVFKSYFSHFEMFLLLFRQKRGTEGGWELALLDFVGAWDIKGLETLGTLSAEDPRNSSSQYFQPSILLAGCWKKKPDKQAGKELAVWKIWLKTVIYSKTWRRSPRIASKLGQ